MPIPRSLVHLAGSQLRSTEVCSHSFFRAGHGINRALASVCCLQRSDFADVILVGEPRRGLRDFQSRPPCRSFSGGLHINWGISLSSEGAVTPITLLSGFLGAGKTTLLKRLLENREGLRIGVIVNDVAAVNIDAQLITSQVAGAEGIDVTELQNGCVCCSLADDLFASVVDLLTHSKDGKGFDHLIVELSGVSEPESIYKNWRVAEEIGHPAALRSKLARVVTVVDTSSFAADWLDGQSAAARNKQAESGPPRSSVELLSEQIEAADALVLNKMDLVGEAEMHTVRSIVSGLNPSAEVLTSSFGDIDLAELLPAVEAMAADSAQEKCAKDAAGRGESNNHHGTECVHHHGHHDGHGHSHSHGHSHEMSPHERYGIHSFVYTKRRPFSSGRLHALVAKLHARQRIGADSALHALAGLLRAKGACWVDEHPLHEHAFTFAGRRCEVVRRNPWWAAMNEQHLKFRLAYPGVQDVYDRVRRESWDKEDDIGDRRQEIVFIGRPDMDENDLRQQLDDCLLNDAEMEDFREATRGLTAPFQIDFGGGVELRM